MAASITGVVGRSTTAGWLPRLLSLDLGEASFATRGFAPADPGVQAALERHGRSFITGYNAALASDSVAAVADACEGTGRAELGFAFEGAGMAWALHDVLAPRGGRRVTALLADDGRPHRYLVHVGAGWAMARLRRLSRRVWRQLDPLLRWLAIDGWGFHDGYFQPHRCLAAQRVVRGGLPLEAVRVYDQGLGRALWFVHGADVTRVCAAIADLPPARHADLFSGVGLAAAYAGGAQAATLSSLRARAGELAPHLAQGAAFAAEARRAGRTAGPEHRAAVELLTGSDPARAAAVTEQARADLRGDGSVEDYQRWRTGIRSRLAQGTAG